MAASPDKALAPVQGCLAFLTGLDGFLQPGRLWRHEVNSDTTCRVRRIAIPLAPGSSNSIVGSNIGEMIRSGHPRAQAIAASLSNARRHPRASGGGIMGDQDDSSDERLRELAVLLGRSPQSVADLNHIVTSTGIAPHAQGGSIPHFAGGGSPLGVPISMADPPWERHQPQIGFLAGATPGRADLVHATPPAGSYVWPADVLAGLGEGNGNAGSIVLQKALTKGPMGTELPRGARGSGPPKAPAPFRGTFMAPPAKRGGRTEGEGEPTPVMAAHGELITSPEIVKLWGRGDLKRGHDLFDKAVLKFRKDHIKDLKHLKPPVKD